MTPDTFARKTLCVIALACAATAAAAQTAPAQASFTPAQLAERTLQRRAVEAAIWGMPLVNFDAMRQAYFRDAGARYNDVMYWSRPSDWKNQTTTPNHSTIYVMFFVNLKDGPVVVDIPAVKEAGLYGTLIDSWTIPMINVGNTGHDKGAGARYVLLPPGWKGTLPAGFVPVQSETLNNYSLLRVITKTTSDADLAGGVDYLKALKIYPLADAAAPRPVRYVDVADKVYEGIARYDASYYESLARMVAEEPVQPRDMSMMGQLRSLDIGKGLTFAPDAKRRQLLEQGVAEAHALMVEGYAQSGRPLWPGKRNWRTLADRGLAYGTKLTFVQPGQGVYIDERAYAWFAMFGPTVPPATNLYVKTYETGKGEALDGSRSYRLTIPANPPAKEFWAVNVYDAATGGFIREAKVVGLDSYNQKVQKNADGSVELYFSPTPPAGREANWISTKPGQRFFAMFRIYGPDKGVVDGSWVLNDIERID